MQRQLYIDEAHTALDIFRYRFQDSALPYTIAVIFVVILVIFTGVKQSQLLIQPIEVLLCVQAWSKVSQTKIKGIRNLLKKCSIRKVSCSKKVL